MASLVGNGLPSQVLSPFCSTLGAAHPVERLHRSLAIAQTLVLALAFVWLGAFVRLDWSLWLVVQDSSADTLVVPYRRGLGSARRLASALAAGTFRLRPFCSANPWVAAL